MVNSSKNVQNMKPVQICTGFIFCTFHTVLSRLLGLMFVLSQSTPFQSCGKVLLWLNLYLAETTRLNKGIILIMLMILSEERFSHK